MSVFSCAQKLVFRKFNSLCSKPKYLSRVKRSSSHGIKIDKKYLLTHHQSSQRFYCLRVGYGSKYHPISAQEYTENKLNALFFDKKTLTAEEWTKIKSRLLTNFMNMNDENFDSIVMNALLSLNKLNLAHSFINYLDETSQKPNLVTCMKYMVLCSRHLSKDSERTILKTYARIKTVVEASSVLDQISVNCIVRGLCATYQWRRSFDFLNKLPGENFQSDTINAIICAALRNDEEKMAWDFMNKHYAEHEHPSSNVVKNYVACASRLLSFEPDLADQILTKFLLFIKGRNTIIRLDCLDEIKNYFEKHPNNWIISDSKINRLGVCSGCSKNLEPPQINMTEFMELEKAFFDKVVKKSDVYINSSVEEMKHFLNFIEKRKPFNIVVDGLNAAYVHSENGLRSGKPLATQLLEVINHLRMSSNKILVLGKKYMNQWPHRLMSSMVKKASVYLVNNSSQDDPMTIYAALASGPNTLFVSSDLVRDHISRLDNAKLIHLFQKWQQSRQVYLKTTGDNSFVFQGPLKHHISIQGDMNKGWHIPYDTEFVLGPYEVINNWLCIHPVFK